MTWSGALLKRALEDIAQHPDSTAREIADRLGEAALPVTAQLIRAAADGKCSRWKPGRTAVWRWRIESDAG